MNLSYITTVGRLYESARSYFHSWLRLLLPRLLGLRPGKSLRVGSNIHWSLASLSRTRLSDNLVIGSRSRLFIPTDSKSSFISIGGNTNIGDDFTASALNSIDIGSDCLISYRVSMVTDSHVTGWGVKPVNSGSTSRPITIGQRCFIGTGAVILPGVSLGDNCVVGANAVVTKSFPAGSVVAGVPARLVRSMHVS